MFYCTIIIFIKIGTHIIFIIIKILYLVSGINKHLSILLLKEKISKELQVNIPIKVLWNYVTSKWDIRAAVNINLIDHNLPFYIIRV